MKFLKSSVLFISMACIVPVCSIAREKRERITRAEIEGSPDKPGGLSIQLCKSEKKEFYIRYSS